MSRTMLIHYPHFYKNHYFSSGLSPYAGNFLWGHNQMPKGHKVKLKEVGPMNEKIERFLGDPTDDNRSALAAIPWTLLWHFAILRPVEDRNKEQLEHVFHTALREVIDNYGHIVVLVALKSCGRIDNDLSFAVHILENIWPREKTPHLRRIQTNQT